MGKLIIQYAVPASILVVLAWLLLKAWYLRLFGRHVQEHNKLNKASRRYDKALNKEKPSDV